MGIFDVSSTERENGRKLFKRRRRGSERANILNYKSWYFFFLFALKVNGALSIRKGRECA